jgi:hypothetical protein
MALSRRANISLTKDHDIDQKSAGLPIDNPQSGGLEIQR